MEAVILIFKIFGAILFIIVFCYTASRKMKKVRPIADQPQESYLLLEAEIHNYGKIGPGIWDKTIWKVYSNRTYHVFTKYIPEWEEQTKMTDSAGKMSQNQMKELKDLLSQQWKSYHVFLNTDNEIAWQMKHYAPDGRCIKRTGEEPESIFGHSTLDGIARILRGLPQENE